MRITIVGCGKVGSALAQQLQTENHEITIVDKSESVIENISNNLDVIGCVGNGAAYPVLKSSNIENCDLLIAVTTSDEVNMLCCLAAHELGAKHTIARVRNPEYTDQLVDLKDDLGLSMAINPERAVAEEITRILRFPSATRVELFAHGRAELVSLKISKGNVLDNLKLIDFPRAVGAKVLICAVSRNGDITIPGGDFVLREGDDIYMTGAPSEIEKTFNKAGMISSRIRNVMLAGGSRIAYYLTNLLIKDGVNVKIIEQDPARALELAELLPKASVLNGSVADQDLLDEEGISYQDAFVALTGLDEGNILSSLYAHRRNVSKVIVKVNNENLTDLISDSALQTIITPKRVVSDQILCYVRALAARNPGGNALSLYKLVNGRAEVLEFQADDNTSELLNVPLTDLRTKKDTLIACIVRDRSVIIPGGSDCILPGDVVLVATAHQRLSKLSDILEA